MVKKVKSKTQLDDESRYQLFLLSETSREKIYKAGRVVSILKDRGEELYVVGPK